MVFLFGFAPFSELKINLGKSELVPERHVQQVNELANIVECRVSVLLLTYLGLPLGASFKNKAVWNSMVERVEKRLLCWKQLYVKGEGSV